MGDKDARRRLELGLFLRTHRARLNPQDVGLVTTGRRRTPGLRREEVAVVANVGVSWYTWLEQGRDIKVSVGILAGVARALRLDSAERAHLFVLAGEVDPDARHTTPTIGTLQSLVDGYLDCPAYIIDAWWKVLATNASAREIIDIRAGTNCMVRFFTEPGRSQRYVDSDQAAQRMVGSYRMQAARFEHDPEFYRTAKELSSCSPQFAQLWENYTVSVRPAHTFRYRHDELGILSYETVILEIPSNGSLALVVQIPAAAAKLVS